MDTRNRRRRNEIRQQGFDLQIEALADSYTSYIYHRDHGTTPGRSEDEEGTMYIYQIRAQDTYSKLIYLDTCTRISDIIYRYQIHSNRVPSHRAQPMCCNSCAGCYTDRAPDTYSGLPRGDTGALQDGTLQVPAVICTGMGPDYG